MARDVAKLFDGGHVRGIERNAGGMPKPISTRTWFTLDGAGAGEFGLDVVFSSDRYGKEDWTVEVIADFPDGIAPDTILTNVRYDGLHPYKTRCGKNSLRFIYHSPDGPDFIPPKNRSCGMTISLSE